MTSQPAGPTPISAGRKSRATRAAEKAAQQPPAEQPKPEPVGVKTYPKTFYMPVVNGEPVECEHFKRYGHDNEKAALACARHLAAAK
jgi:hypothetical protein